MGDIPPESKHVSNSKVLEECILKRHEEAIYALKNEGMDYWSSRENIEDVKNKSTIIHFPSHDAQLLKCHMAQEIEHEIRTDRIKKDYFLPRQNNLFGLPSIKDTATISYRHVKDSHDQGRKYQINDTYSLAHTACRDEKHVISTQRSQVKLFDATEISIPSDRADIHDLLSEMLKCQTCPQISSISETTKSVRDNLPTTETKTHEKNENLTATGKFLGCHCKSPWSRRYEWKTESSHTSDTSVITLFTASNDNGSSQRNHDEHDSLPQSLARTFEVPNETFLMFRVGDISPSFYLHCCLPVSLKDGPQAIQDKLFASLTDKGPDKNSYPTTDDSQTLYWMFIYRQIPSRDNIHPDMNYLKNWMNCLNISPSLSNPDVEQDNDKEGSIELEHGGITIRETPLWEIGRMKTKDGATQIMEHITEEMSNQLFLRKTAPPYIENWRQYYGSCLDHMLESDGFRALREEVQSLPQWTPWPEQNHYDVDGGSDWRVFPLCHTFPASDPSKRKWIESTCSFCPCTVQMLHQMGDVLRTALFSRLGPGTLLAAHTGWQDLANHVVRVHIPLVVPDGPYCGTWVDGCAMMHEEGIVQVFDDSKVHRAFNHSNDERLVLILDLERPASLPMGTAIGGHTEELDAFIKSMT